MPSVFTPFREKVEKQCNVRPEFPAPQPGQLPLPRSLPPQLQQQLTGELPGWQQLPWPASQVPQQPQPNPKAALQFQVGAAAGSTSTTSASLHGGEAGALARLHHYLWGSDLVATYFNIRNGMLGGDYSTKFAPWLSAGCLSPRTIYHELKKYEAQRTANKSTYWVLFELIWRDFFRFYAAKQGSRIFHAGGPAGLRLAWNADPELWERWAAGRTGMPLVDANMRELQQTGWMSNRGGRTSPATLRWTWVSTGGVALTCLSTCCWTMTWPATGATGRQQQASQEGASTTSTSQSKARTTTLLVTTSGTGCRSWKMCQQPGYTSHG
ncbi:DNA photolyase, FAD-binding/Cryptochrome [Scenedesmus sp. NREL 46B-D3]|nr:DNA photolyase, FAD-binding/Cryptochrome [Scenedesmus sp. NREL 46B-D3]